MNTWLEYYYFKIYKTYNSGWHRWRSSDGVKISWQNRFWTKNSRRRHLINNWKNTVTKVGHWNHDTSHIIILEYLDSGWYTWIGVVIVQENARVSSSDREWPFPSDSLSLNIYWSPPVEIKKSTQTTWSVIKIEF